MRGSPPAPETLRLPMGRRLPRGSRLAAGLSTTALVVLAIAAAVGPWHWLNWVRASLAGALVGMAALASRVSGRRRQPARGWLVHRRRRPASRRARGAEDGRRVERAFRPHGPRERQSRHPLAGAHEPARDALPARRRVRNAEDAVGGADGPRARDHRRRRATCAADDEAALSAADAEKLLVGDRARAVPRRSTASTSRTPRVEAVDPRSRGAARRAAADRPDGAARVARVPLPGARRAGGVGLPGDVGPAGRTSRSCSSPRCRPTARGWWTRDDARCAQPAEAAPRSDAVARDLRLIQAVGRRGPSARRSARDRPHLHAAPAARARSALRGRRAAWSRRLDRWQNAS